METDEAIAIVVDAARNYQQFHNDLSDEEEEELGEAIETVNTLPIDDE